ncbi:phosphatase PAP2 family protein [Micropruina sp.]|uniref:phosphatase PAP2 family protein n=1 Tax=Micropruina sp. TaxID=2737536 RepID=UPI0039E53376
MDAVTAPPEREPRPLPGVASPIAAAVLAGALVYLIWWGLVTTHSGQTLEALALEGTRVGRWRLDDQADELLGTVSVPMVAGVIAVVLLIGALRGRWVAAGAAASAVVGANLTTQLLKSLVFQRDDLIGLGAWNGTNTLPSGHTTVAAAALVGLILVVPPWLRSLTTAVGVVGVSAYGLATLVNQWHRPSDVAAAVLVAASWGCLAVAAIRFAERSGPVRDAAHRPGATSVILVMMAICGLALAVAAGFMVWNAEARGTDATTAFIAYVGGVSALVGMTCGGLGGLLRLLDASRPIPRGKQRVELDAGTTAPAPAPPG